MAEQALYIKVRYFIKKSGSVCCKIVSGEKTYTTCLHANGATSCDCDGHSKFGKQCKHIALVIANEAHAEHHYSAKHSTFLYACRGVDAINARYAKAKVTPISSIAERGTLNKKQDYNPFAILPSRQKAVS